MIRIHVSSGTGNSLWVARCLSAALGGAELLPMAGGRPVPAGPADVTGLVFPVHIWGPPEPVLRLARELDPSRSGWVFAVATNAGQPAGTLPTLGRVLRRRGVTLSAGFSVELPSNYTPFGGPGAPEEWKPLFAAAEQKIAAIAAAVRNRRDSDLERGSLAARVACGAVYRLMRGAVPRMDGLFRVGDACTSCGVCEQVCPARNVVLRDGRPTWLHRCEQCLACLHWCPETAIEIGKATRGRARYHHPDVGVRDMTELARGQEGRR